MFFVSNLLSSSQAGRHGFESRLPLHKIKQLASPLPPCTPLYSIYITTSARSSWSTNTFRRSTGDFVYTF
jgi:hypothetical protein